MAIRLGLGLPQLRQYDLAKDVTDVARAAERTGYDSVWVYERLLVPESPTQGLYGVPGLPWPDWYRGMAHPLVTLTLAAAVTERVRLGTGVVVAPLHGPVQLAKALATLDAASGGRVVAGLGTGWSTDEFAAAGIGPHNRRGGLLEEVIKVCRAVWGPDPVSFEGRTTKIDAAVVGPSRRARSRSWWPRAATVPSGGSSTSATAGSRSPWMYRGTPPGGASSRTSPPSGAVRGRSSGCPA